MATLKFRDLPAITRVSTAMTGFCVWVLLEEFVIDRHHLDHWLPFYKVGNLCVYDIAVIAAILSAYVYANRRDA